MIPVVNDDLQTSFEFEEETSKTFKLNNSKNIISGFVDDLEAVKQSVYLILNTERYAHIIYSWNYGIELLDLIGQPSSFVQPELKRRITEALMQDSRITGVDDFRFEKIKNKVKVTFTVTTIFGDIQTESVVNI